MAAQPTVTDPSVEPPDPLYRLDRLVLTSTRAQLVSGAVLKLVKRLGADDLAVLPHLHACANLLGTGVGTAGNTTSGLAGRKPDVTSTLLKWEHRKLDHGHVLTCLTAVLVNAALDPARGSGAVERGHIARLSQIIRGALDAGSDADLLALVGGANGIRGLVQHVNKKLERSEGVHVSFVALWKRWLRDRITGWTLEESSRLHHVLDIVAPLQPDLDAPALDLWTDGKPDADDQPTGSNIALGGEEFEGLSARAIHDRATALQFLRGRAYGGLTLSSDHYIPDELIRSMMKAVLRAADSAFAIGMHPRAEQMLALALVSATGLREIDLQDVVWEASGVTGSLFLDPKQPVLSAPLKRPVNAVNPTYLAGQLRPVAERFDWPIPPSLHIYLRRLVASDAPVAGSPVFPRTAGDGKPRARLWEAISELVPTAQVGAGRIRMALAAKVAHRFGPEVAQLLLRDSLFTSLGPAYYCSVPVGEVSNFLSKLQSDWFGEPIPIPATGDAFLGSRLAMRDGMAREWSTHLKKKAYSAARKKGMALESLRAERDRLAGALCAATGNRPGDSLGVLRLDSVIPEYGLVILQDKQADVLRHTRAAVTGRRWVVALRGYLDLLLELSRGNDEHVVAWAEGVLKSVYPLLSLPEDGAEPTPLDAAALRATMPPELVAVDNFYRHRLNQALQARNVDWELRHAQLGWVVSPAFAMADMSPLSPQILAERLGPAIDDILVEDGWYSPNQRVINWSWSGIPMLSLVDWPSRVADYERGHEMATRHLHQQFKLRREKIEPDVLQRLAQAVEACLPMLRVDIEKRTLVTAPEYKAHGPVALTPEHYALLRDHVRNGQGERFSAVDGLVAERLIHGLVVNAVRRKVASGPEPIYHHVGFTSQLSPFLPGIGLAVRHTMTIRDRLCEIAARNKERDRAGIVQLSILAYTPYRDSDRSVLLAKAASRVVRGETHPGWVRIPARNREDEVPMVLGGVAAAALARCGNETPTMRPWSPEKFATWLAAALDGVVSLPQDKSTVALMVAETCRVAGLLELDGPGRLVMDGYPLAAVATDRELAENEGWPVRTRTAEEADAEGAQLTKDVKPIASRQRESFDVALYARLTGSLNFASSIANEGSKSSSRRGRRQRAERELQKLLADVNPASNLGLIVAYVLHRLRFGGKRRKHLKEGTLHKEVTRFARALLSELGKSSLMVLTSEMLEATYLAVLCRKGEDVRADVLEELVKFQQYLEFAHHVPEVSFGRLRTFAGSRVRRADKGTYTQPEVELILAELEGDVEREKQRIDASPEAIRACELRVIMFLILEGSGLRPQSVHGLLLGDLHLFGPDRDFVHVHTTGGYGQAKTSASKGFIPCEGALWGKNRTRVLEWIESEKSKLGDDWWKGPLFGDATGSRRCFALDYLTSRIHQLGKWVSGSTRAHGYWLRKRRMTQRLREVLDTPAPTARAIFRVLHASGEADILTPLSNYVHDVAVPLRTYLEVAGRPDRAGVLAVTGLRAPPLDMKWHKRRGTTQEFFFGTVLDALGIAFKTAPEGRVTDAPVPSRQKSLLPRHIDRYARALQRLGSRNEAMALCGLSDVQADRLDEGVREMVVRSGSAPWMLEEIRQPAALMPESRHLHGTEKLFGLLDHPPGGWLVRLADAWLRRGHIERLHNSDVVLVLRGAAECDAAKTLLEKTGTRLEFQCTSGDSGVLRLPAADSADPRRRRNAHGGALRWVLAICYLYSCLALPAEQAHSV